MRVRDGLLPDSVPFCLGRQNKWRCCTGRNERGGRRSPKPVCPRLQWTNVAQNTVTFGLLMHDERPPDIPDGHATFGRHTGTLSSGANTINKDQRSHKRVRLNVPVSEFSPRRPGRRSPFQRCASCCRLCRSDEESPVSAL